MEIRPFEPVDYPAITAIHNSLGIVWPERPRTPEAWAQADRSRSPKLRYQRLVALHKGAVVSFASYGQSIVDYHPQRFYVNVEVGPAHQRHGIGTALYDLLLAELQPFDPRVLRADAFTNLPQGFVFLQKRGFYEAFRETPVHLDIPSFDPSPYAGLEPRLIGSGIAVKTLYQLESDPDRDAKLYDLYWEVTEDVPQEDTRIERPPFDEWAGWALADPTILHHAYFIAVHGDGYVGLSEWGQDPDGDVLQGGLLGVRRSYRRQGIALAMQLRAIAYAREHGLPVLKTCTAIQNAPMQALFDKLGFARDPEWLQCQRDVVR
jgi:mycothiol synthase